jgi:hypothetical protein
MARSLRYGLCFASLAGMILLAVAVREHATSRRRAERRLHDWDIAQLAAHLNRKGVPVRLVPVSENAPLGSAAYLTTTAKDWDDLNHLMKLPQRIPEWRGTLYCERIRENDTSYLLGQWGDQGLKIGPFLFYGDTELLDRVRSALDASPATP